MTPGGVNSCTKDPPTDGIFVSHSALGLAAGGDPTVQPCSRWEEQTLRVNRGAALTQTPIQKTRSQLTRKQVPASPRQKNTLPAYAMVRRQRGWKKPPALCPLESQATLALKHIRFTVFSHTVLFRSLKCGHFPLKQTIPCHSPHTITTPVNFS